MKYSNTQSAGYAAQMMCPFRLAQKRPLRSVLYLFVGTLLLGFDLMFSKNLLKTVISNEPVFVVLLTVCGFSVLKDTVSLKRSFAKGDAYVLSRGASFAASMLCTAASLFASPWFAKFLPIALVLCALIRLYTPPVKKMYVLPLFGFVVLIGVVIAVKYVFREPVAVETSDAVLREIFPVSVSAVVKIKKFIISRW